MSRRDTIILAVLLNTGLLALLFIIAVNPDSEEPRVQPMAVEQKVQPVERARPQKEEVALVLAQENRSDEVDNVLKDFAATLNVDKVITRPHSTTRESEAKSYDHAAARTSHTPSPSRSHYDGEEIAMNLPSSIGEPPSNRKKPLNEEKRWEEMKRGNEPGTVEIVVKRGDILGRIAQANNTTVSAIKELNDLTSDSLQIGQQLRVPVGKKEAGSAMGSKKADQPYGEGDAFTRYYIVQSGDNPWKIAKRFNVSVRELLDLNKIDENKARNLRPGDRIRVH